MEHIARAISIIGGQATVARLVEVSPQAVNQWAKNRRPVPPRRAIKIEEATAGAVTRHDLRPDIFGPAPSATEPADERKAA